MRMSNKAKAFFEQAKLTEEYWVEKAKMDFSMELARNASDAKINGKTLAEKIGTSAAYISKVFRGQSNLTIDSMVKLARATGSNIEIRLTPIATDTKPVVETNSSCQVIQFPNKFMNRLTRHKTEISRDHMLPIFTGIEQMLPYNHTLKIELSEMYSYSSFEQLKLPKLA